MPKRRGKYGKKSASAKKPKTTGTGDETDILKSNFGFGELLQRLPYHVVQELFGYLDKWDATRLQSLTSEWKSMLGRATRPNHIAVLEPLTARLYTEVCASAQAAFPEEDRWSGKTQFSLMDFSGVTNIVFLDVSYWNVDGAMNNIWFEIFFLISGRTAECVALFPSLKKVTIQGSEFRKLGDWIYRNWCKVRAVDTVGFVYFSLGAFDLSVKIPERTAFWDKALLDVKDKPVPECPQAKRLKADLILKWKFVVRVPRLDIERSRLDIDGSVSAAWTSLGQSWLWKELDKKGVIWPYPEEQLQWLLNSLNNLDEVTLEGMKFLDTVRMEDESNIWEMVEKLEVTLPATYDARKLTSMDLAFFGRLLARMVAEKVVEGVQPPPFAFPNDFTIFEGTEMCLV